MLTDNQISILKNELHQLKAQLDQTDFEEDSKENIRENTGELSLYDNHPGDMGTELFEREKDFALSIHSKDELNKVNAALEAIENQTYGSCKECSAPIPFERLQAVPYALFCVEHSKEQNIAENRPSEEDILIPPSANTYSERHKGTNHEDDSFQEVARYGTSETPSDFEGDFQDYNQLYDDELKDGFTEEYETFSATDIEGNNLHISQSEGEKEYIEKLDEEGLESPLGDIPYKKTDGYVEEDKS